MLKLCNEVQSQNQARVLERVKVTKDYLLPQCYEYTYHVIEVNMWLMPLRSFSQLASDGQFASLGITLLAELAKIHTFLGHMAVLREDDQDQSAAAVVMQGTPILKAPEDIGRLIERPNPGDQPVKAFPPRHVAPDPPNASLTTTGHMTKSRIRRSKSAPSAIDRIFETLD
ncbi:MAG: hypothetical protein L6R39_007639 [Caloplaca ligustica]|nr:MAG: hypothetical protein L6R39_007639 [Caloplaca ligustica]